eukprot:gene38581-46902_t
MSIVNSSFSVHAAAVKGFNAESALLYEKGRPDYPRESLDHIISLIKSSKTDSSSPTAVIELGAGTGKFTECFSRQVSESNELGDYSIVATEPSEGFRATLQSKGLPRVSATYGIGEQIPVDSKSVDAVVTAQAFHWMANVPTLQEIHRVLKPTGIFIMIWNSYDYRFPWVSRLDKEILSPAYGEHTPRQQSGRWRDCFSTPEGIALFSSISDWFHDHTHHGDSSVIVDRIMSTSVIAEQPPEQREGVRATVWRIINEDETLRQARLDNKFVMPYVTHVASTRPLTL